MAVRPASAARPPAPSKLKILSTADDLFYSEGIHTVGVDRIIAAAHVTKATFYKHFRSKDLLIIAYVEGRDRALRELVAGLEARLPDSPAVLRALTDAIGVEAMRDGFRGCPFINAAAQFSDPEHPVRRAVKVHREWYSDRVEWLMRDSGHPRPGDAADDFLLARDGALAGGHVGDSIAANAALHRSTERILAEAEVGARAVTA